MQSLFKKLINLFHFSKNDKQIPEEKDSLYVGSNEEVPTTSGTSFNVETKVVDLLAEITKLKDDVTKELTTFKKVIKDIDDLKSDAQKAVKKSEKTEDLVSFGFVVLLAMIAGLIFAYWQFTYSDNRITREQVLENQYKMMELEKNTTNFNDFKKCLKSGAWNRCF